MAGNSAASSVKPEALFFAASAPAAAAAAVRLEDEPRPEPDSSSERELDSVGSSSPLSLAVRVFGGCVGGAGGFEVGMVRGPWTAAPPPTTPELSIQLIPMPAVDSSSCFGPA